MDAPSLIFCNKSQHTEECLRIYLKLQDGNQNSNSKQLCLTLVIRKGFVAQLWSAIADPLDLKSTH